MAVTFSMAWAGAGTREIRHGPGRRGLRREPYWCLGRRRGCAVRGVRCGAVQAGPRAHAGGVVAGGSRADGGQRSRPPARRPRQGERRRGELGGRGGDPGSGLAGPEVRAPTGQELKAAAVLTLPICEASVKTRSGPPDDDDSPDAVRDVWAGVIPVVTSYGQPQPSPGPRRETSTSPSVE
jgi:hypothetical protein